MKSTNLLILIALFFSTQLFGQNFMAPLDSKMLLLSKGAEATKNDGSVVSGKLAFATIVNGQLRSFTIKDENGEKQKFKAAAVKALKVKPAKIANIQSAFSSPTLMAQLKKDTKATLNREWVYFERALLPKKSNKPVLMQLLNPGFDSKIKVYLDPNAKETKSLKGLTGGLAKSYLVVAGGQKSMVIKKGKYKKDAPLVLYNNCSVFDEHYGGEKFIWRDFSEHVFVFDQMCDQ